jgi:GNAT superfamily N-acetyltransferase
MTILYRNDAPLTVEQVIALYKRSTLGARRPVDRPDIFAGMLANSNLILSAWDETRLVGIARALTDFVYVTYLADLVVDEDYQRQGIGKNLIHEVQKNTQPECMMILLAAPLANDYYPKLGFRHNPRAWMLNSNY